MREELWPHSIILASCKHGRKPGVSTRFAAGYNNGLQLYWLKIWIYAKYFICYFQGVYIITCNNLHCFKVPHFGKRGIFLYQSVWYFLTIESAVLGVFHLMLALMPFTNRSHLNIRWSYSLTTCTLTAQKRNVMQNTGVFSVHWAVQNWEYNVWIFVVESSVDMDLAPFSGKWCMQWWF